MQIVIPADRPTEIRRTVGSTVTLVNQSATDVYIDTDRQRLMASSTGTVPFGTKLAANGGQVQVTDWFGSIWARAQTQTTIEVIP